MISYQDKIEKIENVVLMGISDKEKIEKITFILKELNKEKEAEYTRHCERMRDSKYSVD